MKATITITTPSGKMLEGFPRILSTEDDNTSMIDFLDDEIQMQDSNSNSHFKATKLHPGDKITIEITE